MIDLDFDGLGLLYTNVLVCVLLLAAVLLSLRRVEPVGALPVAASQELKGLAILSIVFAHVAFMLVSENQYLYPLSTAAGVGVDLFLFMSGYGLTVGMLKRPLPALEFYRRRLIKVFIPLWVTLVILFAADALLLGRHYPATYMLRSLLGWFPRADSVEDVNSPFWYISWLLMFYLLFPWLFMPARPWLTALLFAVIANVVALLDPLHLQVDWLHHLHTNAFALGVLLAWVLRTEPGRRNPALEILQKLRALPAPLRSVLVVALIVFAGYCAAHHVAGMWPRSSEVLHAAGFDENFFVEQFASLLAMAALVVAAMLKRVESRFLHLFGVYSFETYLLHWPLLSRYDIFFRHLQPWLAPFAWLATFIGAGWLLQRITTPLGRLFDSRAG